MSTVTKIKGVIDNPNLPVITDEGLQPYYYGVFINNLSNQDYAMNSRQKVAVKVFLDYLMDNGLLDYIQTIYPFICSQENVNGAKVPLIGNALLDFNSSFNSFDVREGEIIGITGMPAVSSLKLSDVQPNDFVGGAISFNKTATTDSGNWNNVVAGFNSTEEIYAFKYQNNKLIIKARKDAGTLIGYQATDSLDKSSAGSVYMLACFGDGKYCRYAKTNNSSSLDSGSASTTPPVAMTESDMNATLQATSSWSRVQTLTSMTFFKRMLTKEQAKVYVTGLEAFMTALGRNA